MEHFRIANANRHQLDYENCYALSAINAVALAKDVAWEDAYRCLLNQGRRYGLMLTDARCVTNMLREAGYVPVKSFKRLDTYSELSEYLMANYPRVSSGLAVTARGEASEKRVCAIRRSEPPCDGFDALDTKPERRSILQLWMPYSEIGAEAPAVDDPASLKIEKSKPSPAHDGYRYFQPNPQNNAIGDCVIRAYAAVFDVSWGEALEMAAKSNEYTTVHLNSELTYRYLTSEYGFVYHDRLKRNGKSLSGVEFCAYLTATCRHGERIFADAGPSHVVGIVPVDAPEGTQYAILDAWDSSWVKIGRYFVYTPEKKPAAVQEDAPGLPVQIAEGAKVAHPRFGVGAIERIENQRVTICFPEFGQKTFPASWIAANCKGAE